MLDIWQEGKNVNFPKKYSIVHILRLKKVAKYAKTRDECEKLLAEMIEKKKAEIAEMKKKAKAV